MRILSYISLFVILSTTAYGQALFNVKGDHFGVVHQAVSADESIYFIDINEDGHYGINQLKDGKASDLGALSNYPKHGTNADGEFSIDDVLWHNDGLYILGSYKINTSGNQLNSLYFWDGNVFTDLSDDVIRSSTSLNQILLFDGEIHVVGMYKSVATNLRKYANGSWSSVGDVLTKNPNRDNIVETVVYGDHIYASGNFSKKAGFDQFYTAVFKFGTWEPVANPPFVRGSEHFAIAPNSLVLIGTPNSEYDLIKALVGNGWDDLSQGLENVEVKELWDVEVVNNQLYIAGRFRNKNTGALFNLIYGSSGNWVFGGYSLDSQIQFVKNESQIFIYGDLSSVGLQNVVQFGYHGAMLSGRVFEDVNVNCVYDSGDKLLKRHPVVLNPGGFVMWTDEEGFYYIPVNQGEYFVSANSTTRLQASCETKTSAKVSSNRNYVLEDLALKRIPNVVDFEVKGYSLNGGRISVNQYAQFNLLARNIGSANIGSAEIRLNLPDIWDNVIFDPLPTEIIGNTYVWKFTNFKVDDLQNIMVKGTTKSEFDDDADLTVTLEGKVTGEQRDESGDNNNWNLDLNEGEALPPIFKQCNSGDKSFEESDPLNYHIRFENVGSKTVQKIVVRDTLDADLYIDPIKGAEWYSFPKNANLEIPPLVPTSDGKYRYVFIWTFENAGLLNSSSGGDASVGFTNLKINLDQGFHPKGTELCNTAQVLFDNSEPMRTNTVCATSGSLSSGLPIANAEFSIFPNPANGDFTVSNRSLNETDIKIYNSVGEVVQEFHLNASEVITISSESWSKGIYFVQASGFETAKLILH